MKNYVLLFIFVSALVACKKAIYSPNNAKKKYNKSVLVIIEANNNLEEEALNSINGLEHGALNINGVLLVYVKTNNTKSYLLKIKYDNDPYRIVSDTVKTFNTVSATSPLFLGEVIKYAQKEYPAEAYGLILWSHATSWAPPKLLKTKAFGNDGGKEMDVIELKNALPNNFDFLIFDACNMASIEVLYEFKDEAKYIIASPTETIAESFPYEKITPFLFKSNADLKTVAEIYFNHYNSYIGWRQSATVSFIKTNELNGLAAEMKKIINRNKIFGDIFDKNGIQRMDFTNDFPIPAYDFGDFLDKNFKHSELLPITNQLNKLITYKANTPNFIGQPINVFSGLTCYIPAKEDAVLNYYKRFGWYRDSGIYILFDN